MARFQTVYATKSNRQTIALELIPVIEIGCNNKDVPIPDKYPYWEYPLLWDEYNAESHKNAGFKDELNPYLAPSFLA